MPVAPYLPLDQVQLVSGPLHHSASFTYALRGLMTGHTLDLADLADLAGRALAAVVADHPELRPADPAQVPGTAEAVDHPLRDDAGKVGRRAMRAARVTPACPRDV